MPKEPITNKLAIEYLVNKQITPTDKTSAEIVAEWSAADRGRAFFSAQVTKADVLEHIRARIRQVLSGGGTDDQARWWIREFMTSGGANALREMGFLATESDMNEVNRLVELGSSRRIKLIVEQNVRNAQAAAEYTGFQESKATFPLVEYNTAGDELVRLGHARWNKTAWRVDDPAARKIWAPNDFNCRCWMRPLRADELAGRPINWKAPDTSELSPSGFDFDPAAKPEPFPAKKQWADDVRQQYFAAVAKHPAKSRRKLLTTDDIRFGRYAVNTHRDAVKLLHKGFAVASPLRKNVNFRYSMAQKYIHIKNEKQRLRHLGRAALAVRDPDEIWEQTMGNGSIQRIYLKKLPRRRMVVTFEYVDQNRAASIIYKGYSPKAWKKYRADKLIYTKKLSPSVKRSSVESTDRDSSAQTRHQPSTP